MTPIISVIGRKNSGKTFLLECLIPVLTRRGLRIGTLKHHHGESFEADTPGKDSWRHARAGAVVSGVLAKGKTALFLEHEEPMRPGEIVRFFADRVDLVLTEGFLHAGFPIIEVLRGANGGSPLSTGADRLLTLVTDGEWDLGVPRFGFNEIESLADFLILEIRRQALSATVANCSFTAW
ncbi:MAG: molybdopterin-guanine dinucleotide biosynthesis protein B [candidate division NC10 bacterium]|nr:molybdopterin-guanine dinucleotide biosynthesis protein B [candidate division NC10 bacterium]